MSFILDALKKSENERQQQQSAEFSSVPSSRDTPAAPRWLWVLGLLLLVNVVVVGAMLLRPDTPAAATADRARPTPAPATSVTMGSANAPPNQGTSSEPGSSFSDRLAAARRDRPAAQERPADNAATATRRGNAPVSTAAPAGMAALPSLVELQLDGSVDLPPLHIDLHVYNSEPGRRFVSINMNQYRENERMREGPLVRQITREGVVLEYGGRTFTILQ